MTFCAIGASFVITALVIAAALVIWAVIFLEKSKQKYRDCINKAPKFIIKPSYDLGFDIWEKELRPMPNGRPPMMNYRPLFGQYKTYEAAEKQLRHYTKSGVEK